MPLTHQHYQLLLAASRKAFGGDFHGHVAAVRQLEREGMIDLSLDATVRPEPLAVRMGLDERAGLALAAELLRYGYFEKQFDGWTVTADGLEAAMAYERRSPSEASIEHLTPERTDSSKVIRSLRQRVAYLEALCERLRAAASPSAVSVCPRCYQPHVNAPNVRWCRLCGHRLAAQSR